MKALGTRGTAARVTHRLRGRRATAREEILPVVGSGDVLHEEPVLEEFGRRPFSWGWERAGGLRSGGSRR